MFALKFEGGFWPQDMYDAVGEFYIIFSLVALKFEGGFWPQDVPYVMGVYCHCALPKV